LAKQIAMLPDPTSWPKLRPPPPRSAVEGPRGAIIGLSKENRPIICVWRGRANAPLKVLVLAGQHGDERPARRTLQSLLDVPPRELAARIPAIRLAAIPEANPDGCAMRSRSNADGIDPNRDHQLLRSVETAAIHLFVRRWQPHIILDLHNYPSRRRHLLARNIVLNHDVFIDVPSHPAILTRPGGVDAAEVLHGLLSAMAARYVCAARYILVRPSGRARHSTPDVVDARNGLALRNGAFTILVENRQPRPDETSAQRLRLLAAQECALWAVLEWLDQHADLFAPSIASGPPAPASPVPVRFKYKDTEHGLRLDCRDAQQGQHASVTFSRYSASLVIQRTVPLPVGYAVPIKLGSLIGVLRRHGFVSTHYPAGELCPVERLRIARAHPSRKPDRPARGVVLVARQVRRQLDRHTVFLTQQGGGDALAVFLEPESKHGLHRFAAMQIPLLAPSWYPVLRVLPDARNS
jgi:hypothetical protein